MKLLFYVVKYKSWNLNVMNLCSARANISWTHMECK